MSTIFPRSAKKTLGYSLEQVEAFLASARQAYDANDGDIPLTAETIRHTAFSMQKGGYSPEHVDAALERLEDAFAARERERATGTDNEEARGQEARAISNALQSRLSRPPGRRFAHTSLLSVGYKRSDVDRFTNKVVKYLRDGRPLTIDEVRTAVFRPERGGYREAQVDIVLDGVVDVMLFLR
ncbi:DivIVA domain-containing protein [Cryobacterium psychrophilum]|uniref:DivIVA domain-containing protein n=1 Tax=Cryobacterium psychrophilum TaxID=41988 RepID=UPI0010EBCD7A|nr:DivIVA domain-containing protein [Cryobacterium psychrophilum]TDW31245.1 DivIVA domain-containing protein [Cryobacterium psychrophilum]